MAVNTQSEYIYNSVPESHNEYSLVHITTGLAYTTTLYTLLRTQWPMEANLPSSSASDKALLTIIQALLYLSN